MIAHSRLTVQVRISVPAPVRRKLGLGPGTAPEWEEDGDQIVVRRADLFTSEEIHRALFRTQTPETKSITELKEGIRHYARKRHALR